VIAAYDNNGHYAPTLDLSVNTVDVSSGTFNEVVLSGPPSGTLTFTSQGLAVDGVALPVFTQSPFFLLDPSSASLPVLIESYNRLLSIMSIQRAFVSLPPDINIVFQTSCSIIFSTFLTTVPSQQKSTLITMNGGTTVTALDLVTRINTACSVALMPLNFYLSSAGTISVLVSPKYSFSFTDSLIYGASKRFINHLGLNVLQSTYESKNIKNYYKGNTIGVPISSGRGSTIPVPAAPPFTYPHGNFNASNITNTGFQVNFPSGSSPNNKYGIYLDTSGSGFASWDIINVSDVSYNMYDLSPRTNYTTAFTYLTDYDEGPRSIGLPVRTNSSTTVAFDVLDCSAATVTPYTGGWVNAAYLLVGDISNSLWSLLPGLTNVSQIQSITLNYYSGYDQPGFYFGDARFVFSRDQPMYPYMEEPNPVLFYAYGNRIVPSQPGDYYGLGSPSQHTPGPSNYVNTSYLITSQTLLQSIFSTTNDDIIDRSTGIQFYWYCSYPSTNIQKSQINEFQITYYP
jgi:hypothetical protein